jgi:hypothetical protein
MERNKMSKYLNEPAAFPIVVDGYVQEGMTLRDYFAAKAMQGFCVVDNIHFVDLNLTAEKSYLIADAMLKARDED